MRRRSERLVAVPTSSLLSSELIRILRVVLTPGELIMLDSLYSSDDEDPAKEALPFSIEAALDQTLLNYNLPPQGSPDLRDEVLSEAVSAGFAAKPNV